MANFVRINAAASAEDSVTTFYDIDMDTVDSGVHAAATWEMHYLKGNAAKKITFTVNGHADNDGSAPDMTLAQEKQANVLKLSKFFLAMAGGRGVTSRIPYYSHMGMIKGAGLTYKGVTGVATALTTVVTS